MIISLTLKHFEKRSKKNKKVSRKKLKKTPFLTLKNSPPPPKKKNDAHPFKTSLHIHTTRNHQKI